MGEERALFSHSQNHGVEEERREEGVCKSIIP
jgi:hypothetical protein